MLQMDAIARCRSRHVSSSNEVQNQQVHRHLKDVRQFRLRFVVDMIILVMKTNDLPLVGWGEFSVLLAPVTE